MVLILDILLNKCFKLTVKRKKKEILQDYYVDNRVEADLLITF